MSAKGLATSSSGTGHSLARGGFGPGEPKGCRFTMGSFLFLSAHSGCAPILCRDISAVGISGPEPEIVL